MKNRIVEVKRTTKETDISLSLNLDGTGKCKVNTGIGFFDHMIEGFARHGLFDIELTCKGDLNVDGHHTVEDCGIVLGQAIKEAIGDKKGIKRYGSFILPMDETLVMCAIDLCGRPYLGFEETFTAPAIGDFDTQLFREFFYAVSYSGMMNLHMRQICGCNDHHIAEASFKAFAKALDMATQYDERIDGVLSTKGAL